MFKINGKKQTITFIDPRSLTRGKKEIPINIITGYRTIKIPPRRKILNRALGTGYIFLVLAIIWSTPKITVPAWLFFPTYLAGVILITAKTIDDRKIIKNNTHEGEEHIIIETETGDYLVDCGTACRKLATFLDTYLEKQ